MQLLQERIRRDGSVRPGNILKVDSFLNHRIDIALYNEIGKEFARLFSDCAVNKILTIEASGIGIACISAQHFGNIPVVFAKKAKSKNLDGETYVSTVESFTYGRGYEIMVSRKYLTAADRVLLIDDFLANGSAMNGLLDIVRQSGAHLCGAGVVIEKGFQGGGDALRAQGVNLHSLAIIERMDEHGVVFR